MRRVLIAALIAGCALARAQTPDSSFGSDPDKAPTLDKSEQCAREIEHSAMPVWPKEALRSGAFGWVVVRFDLDGNGHSQNIGVEASAPAKVFDAASISAVKRTLFKPEIVRAGCKVVYVYSR